MDVDNLSFDELQKKIVLVRRKKFPDDHTSLTFIKERLIVSDTRKHPTALVEANLAYAGAIRSNVKYLTIKNKQLEKNLQGVRKEAEKLQTLVQNSVSSLGETKTGILVEVSTLGDTMRKLYDGFVTVHKTTFYVHDLQ